MGKVCDICGEDSRDGRIIHELGDLEKSHMQIKPEMWPLYRRLCENHYRPSDIGGGLLRKRIKLGALPVLFDEDTFEHTYSKKEQVLEEEHEKNEGSNEDIDEALEVNNKLFFHRSKKRAFQDSQPGTQSTEGFLPSQGSEIYSQSSCSSATGRI